MDLLIEKINHLQDICSANSITHTLDLPQIVVVGSQSSGKSSVLENIVGRDFLPRGVGIVTRRPLILQLIYSKDAEPEYCLFNHNDTKYTDFSLVKKEILAETSREIKSKNDVSPKPITLKLFSPRVLTLTLVDLPGLVKVPTGDQSINISLKIEEICRSYIINKNAIILAVSAANIDISNSDALQLARSVDPLYDRTIGVLTKVDLMDKGTDVISILSNRVVKLRFGFVPVVSRSQMDIDNNICINLALENEQEFFKNHRAYKGKASYCGTKYLISKLNYILHEHIKACLPDIQQKINGLLLQTQNELQRVGYVTLSPRETILKIINDISKKFSEILSGNGDSSENELTGGARLAYTFGRCFQETLLGIHPLENLKDENIRTLLYNSSGSAAAIVFPQAAFERLAKNAIKLLQPHATKLVSVILNEMFKIINQACSKTMLSRFPKLQDIILNSLIRLSRSLADETSVSVNRFIEWNIDYINAKHPDFTKYGEIIQKEVTKHETTFTESVKSKKISFEMMPHNLKITGQFTKQEMVEIGIMKSFVIDYFDVTRKIVIDQVPKAIMSQLVMQCEERMQQTLFKDVYELENVEKLICDSEETVERRKKLEENIHALKQAYDIMCAL